MGIGQQVKDAQIQADSRGQFQKGRPAFLAGGLPGGASDADGALDGADRNLALNHFLDQFENQKRALLVLFHRAPKRGGKGQRRHLHGCASDANAVALISADVGQNRLHCEIEQLAIALDRDLDGFALGTLQAFDHGREAGDRLSVHVDNLVTQLHSGLFGRHIRSPGR